MLAVVRLRVQVEWSGPALSLVDQWGQFPLNRVEFREGVAPFGTLGKQRSKQLTTTFDSAGGRDSLTLGQTSLAKLRYALPLKPYSDYLVRTL